MAEYTAVLDSISDGKLKPGTALARQAELGASYDARIASPHRFRTKRQLWTYCGLAVTTRSSAEYEVQKGRVQKRTKVIATRGLNTNYNHGLKYVFKSAALDGIHREPFASLYEGPVEHGMRPEMARLTLARKIAAIVLRIWKNGECFDELRLKRQAA